MNFGNGYPFPSTSYLSSGQYKIITIKNVQGGLIDSAGASYLDALPARMKKECFLQQGDVLLSLTGNVGRVGIVNEDNLLLNQRVAKILPKEPDLLPFLYFVFRTPRMRKILEVISKGTAQKNLSPIETLNQNIPFDEKSAKKLGCEMKPLFKKIERNQVESKELTNLRDFLLPLLMNGQVTLRR